VSDELPSVLGQYFRAAAHLRVALLDVKRQKWAMAGTLDRGVV
jgi:hypothetical protein